MSIDRRTFLAQSAVAGSHLLMRPWTSDRHAPFTIPSDFSLKVMATNWGFQGSMDDFCAKAKESGYDGIEVWTPSQEKEQQALLAGVQKHGLALGLLAAGSDGMYTRHLDQFQQAVDQAVALQPLYVNCHSGRDFFTFEQNKSIIDYTLQASQQSGIPIYHETHRSRILFAAHITKTFLEAIPGLRLTLDISHWCNVHESLLQDQQEAVDLALRHTDHIHTRIGHAESPQVTDPRAPEWEKEVAAHFQWWDQVVQYKADQRQPLTVTTEFGPPNYMAMVPYTQQPLANLWEINAYMMQRFRERYR